MPWDPLLSLLTFHLFSILERLLCLIVLFYPKFLWEKSQVIFLFISCSLFLTHFLVWNDSLILANQNSLVFDALKDYNRPIVLILRSDTASTTTLFSQHMCDSYPPFKATFSFHNGGVCPFSVWPTAAQFAPFNSPYVYYETQETSFAGIFFDFLTFLFKHEIFGIFLNRMTN